ncbi:hypothetical protein DL546_002855 [Coniochaeta pulveracea]|uniref:Secreted protein n=1 Tax=Coniochaeta pulveracea TaxID=177199 RepID=A0A420XY96_9PEZI|nr:hypothetical protein DL546_002855 [Coniochaeta pulveracea]
MRSRQLAPIPLSSCLLPAALACLDYRKERHSPHTKASRTKHADNTDQASLPPSACGSENLAGGPSSATERGSRVAARALGWTFSCCSIATLSVWFSQSLAFHHQIKLGWFEFVRMPVGLSSFQTVCLLHSS